MDKPTLISTLIDLERIGYKRALVFLPVDGDCTELVDYETCFIHSIDAIYTVFGYEVENLADKCDRVDRLLKWADMPIRSAMRMTKDCVSIQMEYSGR